ncbi:DUF945 domain-containing protein [Niabella defluvii]|nr:DUF945 domain-containing protein [Niabella sp. I65]
MVCQNTLNASLRNMTNVVRIKHTSGAKQRIENAHKIMGLANTLSDQLQGIFNDWAKVRVSDREVKKLIQLALCPNKETLDLLKKGAEDEVSTVFKNTVDDAFGYAMMSDTQQMDTTKEHCSERTMRLQATFRMFVITRTTKPNYRVS